MNAIRKLRREAARTQMKKQGIRKPNKQLKKYWRSCKGTRWDRREIEE